MATIKAYTTIEQSKKLAEILPLESADAFYPWRELMKDYDSIYVPEEMLMSDLEEDDICAWSLAALLDALPEKYTELIKEGGMYRIIIKDSYMSCLFENPVDACYELILKLHELNLL